MSRHIKTVSQMSFSIQNYLVRKWLTIRMAADEFYFNEPFDISNEYSIMRNVLALSLVPFSLVVIFAAARIFGSLRDYTLLLCLLVVGINILIANQIVNGLKDSDIVNDTVTAYEQLDYSDRKKLYSFKSQMDMILLIFLPWVISGIVCYIVWLILPYHGT